MKMSVLLLFFAASRAAAGQAPSGKVEKEVANAIARIEKALQSVIETQRFQDEMPLPKFLAALEAPLPRDLNVSIRFDDKAFGKDLPLVLESKVRLPQVPKRMSAGTALRLGLSQVVTNETDFDFGPAGIVITHPRGGARTIVQGIGDVVKLLPQLLPTVIETYRDPSVFHGVNKGDGNALLIRLLADDVPVKAWETIKRVQACGSWDPRKGSNKLGDVVFIAKPQGRRRSARKFLGLGWVKVMIRGLARAAPGAVAAWPPSSWAWRVAHPNPIVHLVHWGWCERHRAKVSCADEP